MPAPFTPCEVPKISNKKVTPIPMIQNITPIINGAVVFPEHTTSFSYYVEWKGAISFCFGATKELL